MLSEERRNCSTCVSTLDLSCPADRCEIPRSVDCVPLAVDFSSTPLATMRRDVLGQRVVINVSSGMENHRRRGQLENRKFRTKREHGVNLFVT